MPGRLFCLKGVGLTVTVAVFVASRRAFAARELKEGHPMLA